MPPEPTAGHDVRVGYYWEDDGYGSLPSDYTTDSSDVGDWSDVDLGAFGVDATVDSAEGSNALMRVFEPGTRTAIDLLEMLFEGSFSVSFTLTDPWWIQALLGSGDVVENTDSSTYTFNVNEPLSFGVIEAYVPSKVQKVLKGCYVTQATIDVSVGEEVSISLEGAYADSEIQRVSDGDVGSIIDQPELERDAMTFAEGSISIDGTIESYVQSMSLNLTVNIDPVREIGERVTIDFNEKTVEPDTDFTKILDANEEHAALETLFGGSTTPQQDVNNHVDVVMAFDNGNEAGSGIEKGEFTLSGTLSDTYDESGAGDPTADLEQSISRMGMDISASWETEISDSPMYVI